jgi:hypothetical protein
LDGNTGGRIAGKVGPDAKKGNPKPGEEMEFGKQESRRDGSRRKIPLGWGSFGCL